jgi:hypothetical protein
VAARLVRTLDHWKKYQPALKKQMRGALQKVAAAKGLSKDVQEVVAREARIKSKCGSIHFPFAPSAARRAVYRGDEWKTLTTNGFNLRFPRALG